MNAVYLVVFDIIINLRMYVINYTILDTRIWRCGMQYILSMGRMRNTTTSDSETGGGLAVEENIV